MPYVPIRFWPYARAVSMQFVQPCRSPSTPFYSPLPPAGKRPSVVAQIAIDSATRSFFRLRLLLSPKGPSK